MERLDQWGRSRRAGFRGRRSRRCKGAGIGECPGGAGAGRGRGRSVSRPCQSSGPGPVSPPRPCQSPGPAPVSRPRPRTGHPAPSPGPGPVTRPRPGHGAGRASPGKRHAVKNTPQSGAGASCEGGGHEAGLTGFSGKKKKKRKQAVIARTGLEGIGLVGWVWFHFLERQPPSVVLYTVSRCYFRRCRGDSSTAVEVALFSWSTWWTAERKGRQCIC